MTSKREDIIMVVNYKRKAMNQTGDGHFSPITGINEKNNWTILFDIARYKYPICWVNIRQLYNSLCYKDNDTHLKRGFSIIWKEKYIKKFAIMKYLQMILWFR